MPIFISRENLDKLCLVGDSGDTVSLTTANTEYSYTIPNNTKRLVFGLRSGLYDIRYGWATGETNLTLRAGSYRIVEDVYLVSQTLFVICPDAGSQTLEIETWS